MAIAPATEIAASCSLDAERAVLGAVLLSDRVMLGLVVDERLKPEHFYWRRHRVVFEAMLSLHSREDAIDKVTLADELERRGTLEEAHGKAGVEELAGCVPNLGGIRRYAQIVVEHAQRRERIASAHEQLAALQDRDDDAWRRALERAQAVQAPGVERGFLGKHDLADHILDHVNQRPEPGLPLPAVLPTLGKWVRLRPGQMSLVAAWPNCGKSALAIALASAVGDRGHKAVIWSNEDVPIDIGARYLAGVAGVEADDIIERTVAQDFAAMKRIMRELEHVPFRLQPCHGWSAQEVAAHIRQVRPDVALLDHFHNLRGIGKVDEVDEAIRCLVAVAGQVGCHLVLCAQLNRARLNGVCRPAPLLADLRGSMMFEAACHVAMLPYLEEKEARDDDGTPLGTRAQMDYGHISVEKNKTTRHKGLVRVEFDPRRLRFVESARDGQPTTGGRAF